MTSSRLGNMFQAWLPYGLWQQRKNDGKWSCCCSNQADCIMTSKEIAALNPRPPFFPILRMLNGVVEYDVVKSAIQQAFVDNGATLSHQHAVGTEHAQWLEEDISAPGVVMLEALFEGTDPGKHLNPGKIV